VKESDFIWDKDKEPYEDFLERIPGHMQEMLAEGKAYLAVPLDGYRIMERYMDAVADGNDMSDFKDFINSIETEDEVKQMVSDISALEIVATSIANALLERRHDIHMKTCDVCQDLMSSGSARKVKKALDKARSAFLEAIQEDEDEEWQDNSVDPEAWRKA